MKQLLRYYQGSTVGVKNKITSRLYCDVVIIMLSDFVTYASYGDDDIIEK
jgi:hypothetical protein